MTDATDSAQSPVSKKSKVPVFAGLITALLGAGAGVYIASSGFLQPSPTPIETNPTATSADVAALTFVELDPIIASLKDGENRFLLKFVGSIEVEPKAVSEVEILKPRIYDIVNGYLRALDLEDFEKPAALMQIRSHLLHRIRIVAGEGRIKDLLIIEFVIN